MASMRSPTNFVCRRLCGSRSRLQHWSAREYSERVFVFIMRLNISSALASRRSTSFCVLPANCATILLRGSPSCLMFSRAALKSLSALRDSPASRSTE